MIHKTLWSMRQRMSWTDARKIMVGAGVPTSHGWDKTIRKVEAGGYDHLTGALQDGLVEHILAGGKFTKIYEFEPDVRSRLQEQIIQHQIGDETPAEHYPEALDESLLIEHPAGFVPVAAFSDDDGVGLIASSAFQMKKREEIPFSDFDDPAAYRRRYEEIVGVTFRWVQIMAVVWVPHHRDQIELRIDFPPGMTQTDIHTLHSSLRATACDWLEYDLGNPQNLFPAVRPFYDDRYEGRVTEIMFSTTTGGVKNEKIIKKRGQLDQRDEAYHNGGKQALEHDINLFQVTVEWRKDEDGLHFNPRISLGSTGPSGNGPGGTPTISGVAIGGCVRTTDYEFVISRLSKKLSAGQQ